MSNLALILFYCETNLFQFRSYYLFLSLLDKHTDNFQQEEALCSELSLPSLAQLRVARGDGRTKYQIFLVWDVMCVINNEPINSKLSLNKMETNFYQKKIFLNAFVSMYQLFKFIDKVLGYIELTHQGNQFHLGYHLKSVG